ncbi:MAG TPA: hypothetical protein VKV40_13920 [Ktedonobacteraceae bacterium]|nr:hypothetical protein [Ktedonobacteraceae bacterium]
MRCSYCGLPLSPEKTSGTCPRCSAPFGSKSSSHAVQAPAAWPPAQAHQSYEWGMGIGQPQQQDQAQYTGWQARVGGPGDTPSPTPLFQAIEQDQVWFPAQISMQTPAHTPAQNSAAGAQTFAPSSTPIPTVISPFSGQEQAGNYTGITGRGNRRGGQLGFTIAGLCIITGALLLIFVYIISMELPQNSAPISVVTPTSVPTAHTQPTRAASPTASPSPTTAFPGQQYITDAQMAGSIDKNTAQPLQTTTTFTVGNPVYVTFLVHPGGQAGEVCLAWYLNGQFTSKFSFAVPNVTSTTAYSYTYYQASGPAYVELSWSNSASCSNALLAQRVHFTVQS